MRIFALSDLHVDHDDNARWLRHMSTNEHVSDVLILAGDVSDSLSRLERSLDLLCRRFAKVLFVPGNHDLWVVRDNPALTSLGKFGAVRDVVYRSGASMDVFRHENTTIVPLLGWYDYSFGLPDEALKRVWADYVACRWPPGWDAATITQHFLSMNTGHRVNAEETVVSFSHFVPRIDLMPEFLPAYVKSLFPVLGTQRLEAQVRALGSQIHVYGHSHLNRRVRLDGTLYVNNAFGYPHESRITSKSLLLIHELS